MSNQSLSDESSFSEALLPTPEVYEQEYIYWPWGKLIDVTADWVKKYVANSAVVLDYMCGTGYLLNEISLHRSDLKLFGCSLTPPYIDYANAKYPHLKIVLQDALDYQPIYKPDVIICTAGLHHLEKKRQRLFIEKVAGELSSGRMFLLGEEVIRPYRNERDRKLAALELWSSLIAFVIGKDASDSVVEAAADTMLNDLFERGEYKLSLNELEELIRPYFRIETIEKTWYNDSAEHGDILLICRRL